MIISVKESGKIFLHERASSRREAIVIYRARRNKDFMFHFVHTSMGKEAIMSTRYCWRSVQQIINFFHYSRQLVQSSHVVPVLLSQAHICHALEQCPSCHILYA
jgi:hypothetical protein